MRSASLEALHTGEALENISTGYRLAKVVVGAGVMSGEGQVVVLYDYDESTVRQHDTINLESVRGPCLPVFYWQSNGS